MPLRLRARHWILVPGIGVRIPEGQFQFFLKGRKFLLLINSTYGLLFFLKSDQLFHHTAEGIIGITVVQSKLDAIQQFYMILVMAFLFLAVVGLVAWITVKYPLNLMDKVDENLKRNELMETLLGSDMFKDAVIDIVSDIVQRPQSKEVENGSK